jgi:trehalose 6-phosphate phosphatase
VRYALSAPGLIRLREWLRSRPLLAFDIDGTLAPLVARPWDARVPDAVQRDLAALAQWTTLAIITGRAIADARPMLGFAPRYLIGNHGAEGVPGLEARTAESARICRAWIDQLCGPAEPWRSMPGVTLEDKTYTLAFHFRHAARRHAVARLIEQRVARLTPPPTLLEGKLALNLVAPGAPQKGEALAVLLARSGCQRAIYVGDDASDEAVFRMRLPALLSVRVERQRDSAAAFYLKDQTQVPRFVNALARMSPGARTPTRLAAGMHAGE